MQGNKENVCSNSSLNLLKIKQSPSKSSYRNNNDSSLFLNESSSSWHQQSDATFETIERMCNKTISDPNNTIHEFLANWDKNKNKSDSLDEETEAMNRLFTDFGINIDNSKFANQTQLNEVEPPSYLWENTVNNESCLQTSPVKMVGLLRPSTILEESTTDSVSSYKSADHLDSGSSGQYATANETNRPSTTDRNGDSKSGDSSIQRTSVNSSISSASAYFDLFPLKTRPFYDDSIEPKLYHKTIFLTDRNKASLNKLHDTSNNISSGGSHTSHGISSISNDSLDVSKQRKSSMLEDSLNITSSKKHDLIKNRSRYSVKENDSIISVSDDESGTTESDDLNKGFVHEIDDTREESIDSSDTSGLNISHGFNDTLEEMEYIMKQGMKYLTEKQNTPKQIQTPRTQPTTKNILSPATPNTVISKSKPVPSSSDKTPFVFRPRAIFAAPTMSRFEHIMSPVRAYIHNTPKSPITTLLKPSQNIFDSEMGRESHPHGSKVTKYEAQNNAVCSLPKKAYVSAEYKHVVDQRSPISIPGGDKIHRYLEPSRVPAVLRHEGKYKTNMMPREKTDLEKCEGSLADFSLASGDMSVLLLRDAMDLARK